MRPTLNGLLGGLLSRGRLLMPIRAWTLTLISLVIRRRKSPFPRTVLESQTTRLRFAPLLRLLLPLLLRTSELLCIVLFVVVVVVFFFFLLGFGPRICDVVLNEYFIFYLSAFYLFIIFFITALLTLLFPLLTWIGGYMAFV